MKSTLTTEKLAELSLNSDRYTEIGAILSNKYSDADYVIGIMLGTPKYSVTVISKEEIALARERALLFKEELANVELNKALYLEADSWEDLHSKLYIED